MVYGLDMLFASRQGYAQREVWQVMAYRRHQLLYLLPPFSFFCITASIGSQLTEYEHQLAGLGLPAQRQPGPTPHPHLHTSYTRLTHKGR